MSAVPVSGFSRRSAAFGGAATRSGGGSDAAERGASEVREGRAAARLDTYANSSSATTPRQDRRTLAYRRRAALRKLSTLRRLRSCGSVVVGDSVQVHYDSERGARLHGVASCGSVWACPVHSATILAERRREVAAAVARCKAVGGEIAMLTLTERHKAGDDPGELWDALSKGWASVTSGRAWTRETARYGLFGWLRVVEVTHGRNGWHVHIHALLFLDRAPSPRELSDWRGEIHGRWSRSLGRRGLSPARLAAQDLRLVTGDGDPLAGYFTKQGDLPTAIALEFTAAAAKASRAASKGRTPWQILDDALAGDKHSLALWRDYEQASKGRRQMTWSRGIRDLLGMPRERSDEQIVEDDETSKAGHYVSIADSSYRRLVAYDPDTIPLALTVCEQLCARLGTPVGMFEFRQWLARRKLHVWLPFQEPDRPGSDPPGG